MPRRSWWAQHGVEVQGESGCGAEAAQESVWPCSTTTWHSCSHLHAATDAQAQTCAASNPGTDLYTQVLPTAPGHNYIHPCATTNTQVLPATSGHSQVLPPTPGQRPAHPRTPRHSRVHLGTTTHPGTAAFTRAEPSRAVANPSQPCSRDHPGRAGHTRVELGTVTHSHREPLHGEPQGSFLPAPRSHRSAPSSPCAGAWPAPPLVRALLHHSLRPFCLISWMMKEKLPPPRNTTSITVRLRRVGSWT